MYLKKLNNILKTELKGRNLKKLFIFLSVVFLIGGCKSLPNDVFYRDPISFTEINKKILNSEPEVKKFLQDGPIEIQIVENYMIKVMEQPILLADFYYPLSNTKSPLIIIQHGNLASKEYHAKQAKRLASWGFNVLVLSQEKENQWIENGKKLKKIIQLVHLWPQILPTKVNLEKLIVVGHSFGGSASVIAASKSKLVTGLILLDPALYKKGVKSYIRNIEAPVILLGADLKVFRSKSRHSFYNLIDKNICEVSLIDATHFDAQYPAMAKYIHHINPKYRVSLARQETFNAAIVSASFSLIQNKPLKYAISAYTKDKLELKLTKVRQK